MLRRAGRVVAGLALAVVLAGAMPPESPVADAAMRGSADAVRELLQQGLDVNAAQGDGMTGLHWAAERGDVEITDMLIYAGANLRAVTRIGHYTPLHLASKTGSLPVAQSLLRGGADVSAVTSNTGVTPLHLAAAAGGADLVKVLIEAGADTNARESMWEQTPLTFAAARNRPEAILALLEAGADPSLTAKVVELRAQGRLDQKAQRREGQVLKAFAGEDERSATPSQLQAAIRAGREVYAEGLTEDESEEPDDPNDFRRLFQAPLEKTGGLTPLLHAVRQGYSEATAALVRGGADIDGPSAADGTTPLVMAAINGNFDLALELLELGADPNIGSELTGATPLLAIVNSEWQPRTRFPQPQERALQNASYLDVMKALLVAGADPNARQTRHPWYMVYTGCGNRNCGLVDTNGATAFWRAAYATDVDAMRLLVEYGADPEIPTKAPPRRERLSPDEFLRQQARNALSDSTFAQLPDSSRFKMLSDVRAELPESEQAEFPDRDFENLTDEVRTKLLAAAERADSVRAAGPDPSGLPPVAVGGPAVYPIHAASGVGYGEGFAGNAHRHTPDGWLPAVKFLIEELGADVDARDHNGYTALHHAAARGDNEMIGYLVERGADVLVVSRRGQTTADMANGPVQRVSPHPETVALLVGLGAINNDKCVTC